MLRGLSFAVVLLCLAGVSFATIGVDISIQVSQTTDARTYSCLKKNNYEFVIIDVFSAPTGLNPFFAQNVKLASEVGFGVDLDVYLCERVHKEDRDVVSLVNKILDTVIVANYSVKIDTVWFDVQDLHGCWYNKNDTIKYFARAFNAAHDKGFKVGVYSNAKEWPHTVGKDVKVFSEYPLWYTVLDNKKDFNDAHHDFGGFTPALKQYYPSSPCAWTFSNWTPSYPIIKNTQTRLDIDNLLRQIEAMW